MKKICLVGSVRYKALWQEANFELTKRGHVVYSVSDFRRAQQDASEKNGLQELTTREKEILDLVHLQKILHSEVVVLVSPRPFYYGDSTRRELTWALMLGKPIFYYDPEATLRYGFHKDFGDLLQGLDPLRML